ncbi:PHP domain-containing protein [Spartinivicinus poritis]|uniref:PHP domain-containing protein n=1 Tax=Spartinivicinus poritis TaxID=2994640 RepID=A0ABT5U7G6_9GAMM|nr:PHP domain-containing protein [Spartinivicinus sp. A2-2]MDE1462311.1 PHP domain-containing protein [Spartinivicinus sp. A2-2]
MKIDLHCHSTASDGVLSPLALVQRAIEQKVEVLSLTDHDTVAGYQHLQGQAALSQLYLIPGIELSAVWSGVTIHVVGLGFSLDDPLLAGYLDQQQQARQQRAEKIAAKLAKRGFANTLEGALAVAQGQSDLPAADVQIGRPHFAKYLVSEGYVPDMATAFNRYLGAGKVGDVKSQWPSLAQVVDWITSMKGVAILAHPLKYKMTNTKLRALIKAFKAAGGEGIEVALAGQPQDATHFLAELSCQFELLASVASDFHGPFNRWIELGGAPPLPKQCKPLWENWMLEKMRFC